MVIKNFKIYFLLFLLSLIFTAPILLTGNNLGIQDWDTNFAYFEVARKTILEFKQFPFWNPYICGGVPLFGHPDSNIPSLTFLFTLFFGTIIGVKISILFHYFIGLIGFYLLTKEVFNVSNKAALFSSFIFVFSGVVSSTIGTGMICFMENFYNPFLILFFLKSLKNRKYILVSAIILSLQIYSNYHIPIIFIPSFILYILFFSIIKKSKKPLINLFLLLILVLIICLPKLTSVIEYSCFQNPKYNIDKNSGYSLLGLIYSLFWKYQPYYIKLTNFNMNYRVDEASLYLGFTPLIFFFLGVLNNQVKNENKIHKYVILFLLILNFFLMMGDHSIINLWRIIKMLPFYDQFRVAQRFRFNFIIFFALISSLGWDLFFNKLKKNNLILFLQRFLLLFMFTDLFLFSYNNFFSKSFIVKNLPYIPAKYKNKYNKNPITYRTIPVNFKLADESLSQEYKNRRYLPFSNHFLAVKNNLALINCYIVPNVRSKAFSVDKKDYKGEIFLLNKKGSVSIIYWSPNKITIKINKLLENDRLIINQNWSNHWYFKIGKKLIRSENYNGLNSCKINKDLINKSDIITFEHLPFKFN